MHRSDSAYVGVSNMETADNSALVAQLLAALMETSTMTDHAASNFADVMRCNELLSDQAITVERIIKALRAHFEGLAGVLEDVLPLLPPEEAGRLQEVAGELRGRLGIAAGALRRWTLGAQSCADSARQASTTMRSVRTAMAEASAAAEQILIL
jgi:hypothetical protein